VSAHFAAFFTADVGALFSANGPTDHAAELAALCTAHAQAQFAAHNATNESAIWGSDKPAINAAY
jgi:hypothetical protein